jgi:SAM-dependent methyltransferase
MNRPAEVTNAYEDEARAEAYANLAFQATYHLAYRDLPRILSEHVAGRRALDFGCGAGRSTRFLRALDFEVVGVDVSSEMLGKARALDPGGRYERIGDGDLAGHPTAGYDLVLAAYPFDNIAGPERRVRLMEELRRIMMPTGRLVLVASTPELYVNEWATFTTAAFPENAGARSGERVRIVIKEGGDTRPIDDLIWFDADYRDTFRRAGFELLATHRPLALGDEPFDWVNETRIPPWVLYVAGPQGAVPQ